MQPDMACADYMCLRINSYGKVVGKDHRVGKFVNGNAEHKCYV